MISIPPISGKFLRRISYISRDSIVSVRLSTMGADGPGLIDLGLCSRAFFGRIGAAVL